jgi:hypothetical protein
MKKHYMASCAIYSVLAAIACAAVLTACGAAPTTPVWKYQTILIAPDKSMMQTCPVEPPPNITTYMAADLSGREGLDEKAYNNQTKNVALCNQQTSRLSSWVDQQKALYPDALTGASATAAASASSIGK